ncbi:hypothetical protein [Viridibacillus arvi]|uniref:hypothetical protein n=1 Tax=Viridibacillus arvi TaxID=263475 RepID=UPI003D2B3456
MVRGVTCFLSDENGLPLDPNLPGSIIYKELTLKNSRPEQCVVLANGFHVTLQQVKILISGFVTIVLDSGTQHTEPFSETKLILLCAPNGTQITCAYTDFNCFSQTVYSDDIFQGLLLFVDFCLSVQIPINIPTGFTNNISYGNSITSTSSENYFVNTRNAKIRLAFFYLILITNR